MYPSKSQPESCIYSIDSVEIRGGETECMHHSVPWMRRGDSLKESGFNNEHIPWTREGC